jgi:hypothetical protein
MTAGIALGVDSKLVKLGLVDEAGEGMISKTKNIRLADVVVGLQHASRHGVGWEAMFFVLRVWDAHHRFPLIVRNRRVWPISFMATVIPL